MHHVFASHDLIPFTSKLATSNAEDCVPAIGQKFDDSLKAPNQNQNQNASGRDQRWQILLSLQPHRSEIVDRQ